MRIPRSPCLRAKRVGGLPCVKEALRCEPRAVATDHELAAVGKVVDGLPAKRVARHGNVGDLPRDTVRPSRALGPFADPAFVAKTMGKLLD